MRLLAFLLLLLAGPALADSYVARSVDGTLQVRLLDAPCEQTLFRFMLGTAVPDGTPKVAEVTYGGQKIAACWVLHEDPGEENHVDLADEGGNLVSIPLNVFQKEPRV